AFIISREGEFQPERRSEPSIDPGLLDSFAKQHFLNDTSQFREYQGEMGKEYFLVSVPLKSGEWVLVLQQEREDALVELYRARWVAMVVLVFGGAGIVFTVVILTRRMQRKIFVAEQEQKIMHKQVVEAGKLAAIGELAAGIAHEINNPVAIMVECAGWIKDLMGMPEYGSEDNLKEIQETLKEITIQGGRCKEITHKLLSFARKTDSRVQEVDIPALLEEIISLTHQKARFGNVTVRTEVAPDLPKITASPTELQQVVLNLINNAIDAISKKEGVIVVRAARQGEDIVIDVADNGQGIPPADLHRIFEPFYTTKPVGKGTGLGLAICYGIINKMGGDITVESELNVGTTFHVRIPVTTNSTPA
ncbi:MAG: sensor histidine kinase, partial [Desulfovibrionaceae bacterium]